MSKWIAEFELEDGDTMPEHMDLEYKGARIDFHCKPLEQEPILDRVRAEIEQIELLARYTRGDIKQMALDVIDKYKGESV